MVEEDCNLEEALKSAVATLKATFVPSVTSEKPCGEEDFKDYKQSAEINFEYLKKLLHNILEKSEEKDDLTFKMDTSFITPLLLLCAEHAVLQPWSTPNTVQLSHETLAILCQVHACSTVGECLVGGKMDSEKSRKIFFQTNDQFKLILLYLHPKLLKETWKSNPAAVAAFMWLLLQVKFPYLNLENHGMAFTTSLIILDDFVSENKLIGIKCLHHYIENVTSTDFRCYGRDVVVYDALFSHLYTREAPVLECLLPCTLACLNKMEPMMSTPDKDIIPYAYQWGKFEDVLSNMFSAMIMDENIKVRMVYLKYLPHYIQARGIRIVLFTKQILSVLDSYLEARGIGSDNLIKTTLEVFLVFMKAIQLRLPAHALDVLQLLLQKLQDLSTGSRDINFEEGNSEIIIHLIGENIKFLIHSAPGHFSDFSIDFIKSLQLNKTATSALIHACEFS